MKKTASEYFGARVDEYDSLLRRAVPRYQELIERVASYIPPGKERVLELGCGTGNFSVAVAASCPDAAMTLVDGSREMLACAAARISQEHVVLCAEVRFEELNFAPGSFDLITSCIALHHVESLPDLYAKLYELLAPGGHLIYGDQMAGATELHSSINWAAMEDFWKLPGHLSADERQSLADHAIDHDHYVSVPDQLRWMEAVGLSELDCVWRNWMWGVLSGKRA